MTRAGSQKGTGRAWDEAAAAVAAVTPGRREMVDGLAEQVRRLAAEQAAAEQAAARAGIALDAARATLAAAAAAAREGLAGPGAVADVQDRAAMLVALVGAGGGKATASVPDLPRVGDLARVDIDMGPAGQAWALWRYEQGKAVLAQARAPVGQRGRMRNASFSEIRQWLRGPARGPARAGLCRCCGTGPPAALGPRLSAGGLCWGCDPARGGSRTGWDRDDGRCPHDFRTSGADPWRADPGLAVDDHEHEAPERLTAAGLSVSEWTEGGSSTGLVFRVDGTEFLLMWDWESATWSLRDDPYGSLNRRVRFDQDLPGDPTWWELADAAKAALAQLEADTAARRRRADEFGITVKDLVDSGLLRPGQVLVSTLRRAPCSAIVTADGQIEANGQRADNPTGAAKLAHELADPTNGWTFWALGTRDGRRLAAVRRDLATQLTARA